MRYILSYPSFRKFRMVRAYKRPWAPKWTRDVLLCTVTRPFLCPKPLLHPGLPRNQSGLETSLSQSEKIPSWTYCGYSPGGIFLPGITYSSRPAAKFHNDFNLKGNLKDFRSDVCFFPCCRLFWKSAEKVKNDVNNMNRFSYPFITVSATETVNS